MTEMTTGYELYLAPNQQQFCDAVDLEKHLKETKFIDRAFSLDDELIKGWIANPETYPEDFRRKSILLWKSVKAYRGHREVPHLRYFREQRHIIWGNGRESRTPAEIRIIFERIKGNYSNCSRPTLLRK